MMKKDCNHVIKVFQTLRKLGVDITSTNKEIVAAHNRIIKQIDIAGEFIVSSNDIIIINVWLNEKAKLIENIIVLHGLLISIEDKLRTNDCSNLIETRQTYSHYKDVVTNILQEMQNIGNIVFTAENLKKWESVWEVISESLNRILSVSEIYKLKLTLMQSLEPDEIDVLTCDILKYIPLSYSDTEAQNNEKEYLKAYHDLHEFQSEKKNLLNKVLNILADGMEETKTQGLSRRM